MTKVLKPYGSLKNSCDNIKILEYLEDKHKRVTKERCDAERELVKLRKEVNDKLYLEVELMNMMNEIRLKMQGCDV